MISEPSKSLLSIIDKTETNLKRIERVSGDFIYTVLNEWRYATRHIVKIVISADGEDEYRKAVSHLKRAYFDSCDILLDCQLDLVARYSETYSGYSDIMIRYIPDFKNFIAVLSKAKAAHFSAQSLETDKREENYDSLSATLSELDAFIKTLEETREFWIQDIRKQKKRDRLPVLVALIPIAAAAVGYVWKMFFG